MRSSLLVLAALVLGASAGTSALADPTPCVGCYLVDQQTAVQAQVNRAIVQGAVSQGIANQLQVQTQQQTMQAQLAALRLQESLVQSASTLQLILLEEQMRALQLPVTPTARSRAKQANHPH